MKKAKTMTEVFDAENVSIAQVRAIQSTGDYSSAEYKEAVATYKRCVRNRQKLVRETKKELLRLQQQMRKVS